MAKRSGSYESLIRGVSQQVPHDRLPGQHWTQDNFISDPVRGLARRHGSKMLQEKALPGVELSGDTLADAVTFKEASFYVGGVEHSVAYRPGAKPAGSTLPALFCVNKDASNIMDVVIGADDPIVTEVLDGGISTVATVGRYILMGAASKPTTFTQQDTLALTADSSVVWIKGGGYSRTFRLTCYNGSTPIEHQYTTMPSYYQGALNTSDIPQTAGDYQKQVNDRVNAYNTAVNQHIAAAAADIQPANIAEKFRELLDASGITVERVGSHLLITGPTNIAVDDGGDGFLMKAVAQEVDAIADLSAQHIPNKTVRVAPRSGGADYYMQAVPKVAGLSGLQEVTWKEAPGVALTPGFLFLIGAISADGNTLYLGSSPTKLEAVSGIIDVPRYQASQAGDAESSPAPYFFGNTIAYMRSFQDRLMIVSGAVIYMSKPGDYFNFFRSSVLTLADDDPLEVFAEGSEGDVITDSVQLDRSLLLFGRRQQYAIPGREAIRPATAFCAVQSAHEDATTAPPVTSGNLIFFTQERENRLTVQQMQTGAYADSFDAFDITTQLDGYLLGTPRQIVAMTSPSMLFIRTQEFHNGVYLYSYLDSSDASSRLFDSWSRWVWQPTLGTLLSISQHNSALLTLTLRQGVDGTLLVLDAFSRESVLDTAPYLDSRRPFLTLGSMSAGWAGADVTAVALNAGAGSKRLLGRDIGTAETLFIDAPGMQPFAEVGVFFDSCVEPTSPYIRDQKDKAVLDARLTISRLAVTVADSVAMTTNIRGMTAGIESAVPGVSWIHRQAGMWTLNTQQIASTHTETVPIMREIRDYRLQLCSRNWLPLTISSIEWSGQFFTSRKE